MNVSKEISNNKLFFSLYLAGILLLIFILKIEYVLFALLILTLLGFIVYNLRFGIYLMVFCQFFLSSSTEELMNAEIAYIILFFLVFTGWLLRIRLYSHKNFTIFEISLIVFLSISFFSIAKALLNHVSPYDWFRNWYRFLNLALFFVIVSEFRTKKQINSLIFVFLGVSVLISFKGFYWLIQQGFLNIQSPKQIIKNLAIFRLHSLEFANYYYLWSFMIIFPIFAYPKRLLYRFSLSVLSVIFIIRFLLSFSRLNFLILAFSIILTLILLRKELVNEIKYDFSFLLVFTVLIFIFYSEIIFSIWNVFSYRFGLIETGIVKRASEYNAALAHIIKQPILGHGYGFKIQFYKSLKFSKYLVSQNYVHNIFLFLLLQVGIVGTVSFLVMYISALKDGWKLYTKLEPKYWKYVSLGLFLTLIGQMILGLGQTALLRQDSTFFLTLNFGLIYALKKVFSDSSKYSY